MKEADRGHHGEHRVAQHVPAADDAPLEALGLGGADVVLVLHLEDAGAGHAHDDRERMDARATAGRIR
ncbi:hypothetical protein SHIRM173S_03804 [Streptomyces hirsutus]